MDDVHSVPLPRGVGGRQGPRRPPAGGGGYLDERTAPEVAGGPDFAGSLALARADARLRELAEIGLSSMWLGVAVWLGYDRWMELWRLLSSMPRALTEDGQIVVKLRGFSHYQRYQRDLYIRALKAAGLPSGVILATVRRHLADDRGINAITRVAKDAWADTHMASRNVPALSPFLAAQIADVAGAGDLFPRELEHAMLAEACLKPGKATPADRDPRIAELIDIGLSDVWLPVARQIGYDDFVTLWAAWSAEPSVRHERGGIVLRLRAVRSFETYQRNRYVETLVAAGIQPSQIRTMLKRELGEELSRRHLNRLISAAKVAG